MLSEGTARGHCGGWHGQNRKRIESARRDYKAGRSRSLQTGGPFPCFTPLSLIESSSERDPGPCFSNQGKTNGIVFEEKGQRGQVQTGRMLGFCQSQPGLWDHQVQEASPCANHPRDSFSNIPFSILPQGPESMVSCQEVKPASPGPWGKLCLALEEGEDAAAPGQRESLAEPFSGAWLDRMIKE